MINLIECNNNWLIVDKLDDISDLTELLNEVDQENYSEFTTAMGTSTQNYFFNPLMRWKREHELQIPPSWTNIKLKYESIIENYLKKYKKFSNSFTKLSTTSAWTVTGNNGSYHTPHEHGLGGISAIVYTNTLNYSNPEDNGPIYFILNSDEYDLLYSPYQRIPRFIPENGMILIFPSWIIHGTLPQSEGKRTTISFDFKWE